MDDGYVVLDGYALVPTRTIGSCHFRSVGVISEPDLHALRFDGSIGLIAGSDGLWDRIISSYAAQICRESPGALEACSAILDHCLKTQYPDLTHLDNISIIVVKK